MEYDIYKYEHNYEVLANELTNSHMIPWEWTIKEFSYTYNTINLEHKNKASETMKIHTYFIQLPANVKPPIKT